MNKDDIIEQITKECNHYCLSLDDEIIGYYNKRYDLDITKDDFFKVINYSPYGTMVMIGCSIMSNKLVTDEIRKDTEYKLKVWNRASKFGDDHREPVDELLNLLQQDTYSWKELDEYLNNIGY